MNLNQIVVVVPTYNNLQSIKSVAMDIIDHGYKLIVVDDGSKVPVGSLPSLKNENIIIIRHEVNRGKGAAILTGAKQAQRLGYNAFITLDGDGQHMASEIPKLLNACNGDEQIIIGARNFEIENVPGAAKFGRSFSNFWAILNTSQIISDSLSGFRLYPVSILNLNVKSQKYDFEMEVLVRHAWKKRKIKEIEIECYYPPASERVSHFRKFKDTMAIVWVHIQLLPQKILFLKGLF